MLVLICLFRCVKFLLQILQRSDLTPAWSENSEGVSFFTLSIKNPTPSLEEFVVWCWIIFSYAASFPLAWKYSARFATPRDLPQLRNSSKSSALTWHLHWYINCTRFTKCPESKLGKYTIGLSCLWTIRSIFNLELAEQRTTLWALTIWPSSVARVTSEKFSSFHKFRIISGELDSKSCQEIITRLSSSISRSWSILKSFQLKTVSGQKELKGTSDIDPTFTHFHPFYPASFRGSVSDLLSRVDGLDWIDGPLNDSLLRATLCIADNPTSKTKQESGQRCWSPRFLASWMFEEEEMYGLAFDRTGGLSIKEIGYW